jgi:hypothetical protein
LRIPIERRYWEEQGIDWGIVTERELPLDLVSNIALIHPHRYKLEESPFSLREIYAAAVLMSRLVVESSQPLKHIALDCDDQLGLGPGSCLAIACYNNVDKLGVRDIGEGLKDLGLLPWFDEWELQPGLPWQKLLESQIEHIKSAAVFVGKEGIGPWQQMELEAFLREFVRRDCSVIPVLLPDAPKEPHLPLFLKGITWVDFRQENPDPMEQLLWGITGKRIDGR